MRMEQRRPRESHFEADNPEARLARLREHAPTLESSRRLRLYAIFGSLLMILAVTGFYVAMKIYKAVTEDRQQAALIEVDQALGVLPVAESERALQRMAEEQAAAEAALAEQLAQLQGTDLLEQVEQASEGAPAVPQPLDLSGQLEQLKAVDLEGGLKGAVEPGT